MRWSETLQHVIKRQTQSPVAALKELLRITEGVNPEREL